MKHPVDYRDWITFALCWALLFVVTWLAVRLWRALEEVQSSGIQRDSVSERKFLSKIEPRQLAKACTFFLWIGHVTETVSWTYTVVTEKWDSVTLTVDAFTILFSSIAYALVVVVFANRCHFAFENTAMQHSTRVYNSIYALFAVLIVLGVLITVLMFFSMWLVAYAFVLYFVTLLIATSKVIHMFVSPLRGFAQESDQPQFLHVAVRITVVSTMALVTTCTLMFLAVFSFAYCGLCNFSFVYYNLSFVDRIVNLLCLTWALKCGNAEYMQACGCVHNWCTLKCAGGMDTTPRTIATLETTVMTLSKSKTTTGSQISTTEKM